MVSEYIILWSVKAGAECRQTFYFVALKICYFSFYLKGEDALIAEIVPSGYLHTSLLWLCLHFHLNIQL